MALKVVDTKTTFTFIKPCISVNGRVKKEKKENDKKKPCICNCTSYAIYYLGKKYSNY